MSAASAAMYQARDKRDIPALVDARPLAWMICGNPSEFAAAPVPGVRQPLVRLPRGRRQMSP